MPSRRHQHSRQKLLTCFFHVVRVLNFASYRLCEYDAQEERRTRHKTYTFSSDCCCVKAVATLVDILGWLPPLGCAFLPLEGETREWLVRGTILFLWLSGPSVKQSHARSLSAALAWLRKNAIVAGRGSRFWVVVGRMR